MIAHSNILNEIFRGKFSHNRDHCSPPPAAGLCKEGLSAGAALELGLTQGAEWHEGSWFSCGLGVGDGLGTV